MSGGRWIPCHTCKHPIWMDGGHEAILRQNQSTWYCLWGHQQYFPAGPTEADKLRLERDRLKQENARLEDARVAAERAEHATLLHANHMRRQAAAARGQVTRLKNRAAAGVCPCCNRSFENLRRHMESKHRGFAAEASAPIGATVL